MDTAPAVNASGLRTKVLVVTGVLILCSNMLLMREFLQTTEPSLLNAIRARTLAVGDSLSDTIQTALGYGIPLESLRGVEEVFGRVKNENPDLAYIALAGCDGDVLYTSDNVPTDKAFTHSWGALQPSDANPVLHAGFYDHTVPVLLSGRMVGVLHLGVPSRVIRDAFRSILYDNLTVLLVTAMVALELLGFLLRHSVDTPLTLIGSVLRKAANREYVTQTGEACSGMVRKLLDQFLRWHRMVEVAVKKRQEPGVSETLFRDKPSMDARGAGHPVAFTSLELPPEARLPYVRPVLFLLVFANALSLSFFPIFIDDIVQKSGEITGLNPSVIISLPISAFMLSWAISQPLSGILFNRLGQRNSCLLGAFLLALGQVGSGMAWSFNSLIAFRSLEGMGYGIVFITTNAFVVTHTTRENRTQGMAMFLSAFFSGTLCGSAIGGILADRIGYRPIFFMGACIALLAMGFIWFFFAESKKLAPSQAGNCRTSEKSGMRVGLWVMAKNVRFLALTLCVAIPAKICLTGLMNYMAPLYLSELHESRSTIGRVLMAYGLIMVLGAPLLGRVADRFRARRFFVFLGSLMAGGGVMVTFYFPSMYGVTLTICLMGLAHAVGVSSAMAMVPELCEEEIRHMGAASVLGIYRLIERVGSIAGPLIAGTLIAMLGFKEAFLWIGIITIVGVILFGMVLFIARMWRRYPQETDADSLVVSKAEGTA